MSNLSGSLFSLNVDVVTKILLDMTYRQIIILERLVTIPLVKRICSSDNFWKLRLAQCYSICDFQPNSSFRILTEQLVKAGLDVNSIIDVESKRFCVCEVTNRYKLQLLTQHGWSLLSHTQYNTLSQELMVPVDDRSYKTLNLSGNLLDITAKCGDYPEVMRFLYCTAQDDFSGVCKCGARYCYMDRSYFLEHAITEAVWCNRSNSLKILLTNPPCRIQPSDIKRALDILFWGSDDNLKKIGAPGLFKSMSIIAKHTDISLAHHIISCIAEFGSVNVRIALALSPKLYTHRRDMIDLALNIADGVASVENLPYIPGSIVGDLLRIANNCDRESEMAHTLSHMEDNIDSDYDLSDLED